MTLKKTFPVLFLISFFVNAYATAAEIPGAKQVTENIYRGPRPKLATIDELARLGIRTLIDIQGRAPKGIIPGETMSSRTERKNAAERLGMHYYNIPTTLLSLNAEEKAKMLKIVALMDNPRLQPVYVHCSAGKDRTGVIIALYRILYQGCSYDSARQEMLKNGLLWTSALMGSQMPFLREMEQQQRQVTGRLRQRCPL